MKKLVQFYHLIDVIAAGAALHEHLFNPVRYNPLVIQDNWRKKTRDDYKNLVWHKTFIHQK